MSARAGQGDICRFQPGPDQLAVTVDFYGRCAMTIVLALADLEAMLAQMDAFVAMKLPDCGAQEKFAIMLDAVAPLMSRKEDEQTLIKAAKCVLWVCLNDDTAAKLKRSITDAVMKYGFAHVTIASNERGRIAYAVSGGYVPLREYGEVFLGRDIEIGGGLSASARC